MARYKVTLSYDGTGFQGYQRQKNRRTVQGCVEQALQQIGWTATSILSAGRTDTGVHASGQVIAFDLEWNHPPEKLVHALNAALPPDIAVVDAVEANGSFHPRYSALARDYHYSLLLAKHRNPLLERYCWRIDQQPDLCTLNECAAALIGKHDFAAYGTPPRPGSSTVRQITRSEWVVDGNQLDYYIRGNAFLYHMVRRLVFIQVEAALGRVDRARLLRNPEEGYPEHPGIAPAAGLVLTGVMYDEV